MISTEELTKVLDRLEARECELIVWGDTGVFFALPELEEIIHSVLPGYDPEEVEDELRQRVLIIPVLDTRDLEIGVRTRMAESLHLYRNLRQWMFGRNLDQSNTLVSDYRFIRQRRRYPARDLEINPLLEDLQASGLKHSSTIQAIRELVDRTAVAGFQARTTSHILSAWEGHLTRKSKPTGTIVSSGTGSGKTMAFYLPALSSLATDILNFGAHRVRILAIYPRNELLKDQFHETWEQARKLDKYLLSAGSRKIRIGALFGEIPNTAKYALKEDSKEFLQFRLLKCVTPNCLGEMRWSKSDIQNNHERLVCHLCGHVVLGDEVALTRTAMVDTPPDVLFVSTEMLNQRMSDARLRHLFGIGQPHTLPLVLLDEIHTYGGNQGAHTALLLRRWMKLSGNRPHFVGLSATLRDATNFFSSLTGTSESQITLIEPRTEEMFEEGAEYLLALRGDPVSQTALLSTTIQSAMLTRRALDHINFRKSDGLWGCKTFVFTDDLDVNNRLYSALTDAEGWWQRGNRLVAKPDGPLAQLRNSSISQIPPKTLRAYGQDWAIAKASGFSLDAEDRARIARTSSLDTGYDHEAEIIVTTASLEVGFNDTDVGAVIQHKAPRGVSSYLQRRGRAGRPRKMRPWMIIVLSDFGRDRVAYQQYENLIDPELKVQRLPVDNSHILKIQAASAVLDWLSRNFKSGCIWSWLNYPKDNVNEIAQLLRYVDEAMVSGPIQDDLCDYIRTALDLSEDVVNRLLWQAPRSVLLEFLPTLRRQLQSKWGAWSDSECQTIEWAETTPGWGSPCPEFIPSSSFADLNAPELRIKLNRRDKPIYKDMPYFQGLKEFAPGRISKRYAVASGAISDWLVPDNFIPKPEEASIDFEIEEAFGPTTTLVASDLNAHGESFDIYQPYKVLTSSLFADKKIADTSNAFLRWKSTFLPSTDGSFCAVPSSSMWAGSLNEIAFFTHGMMAPLELIRYNMGSDATVKFRDGRAGNLQFNWTHCQKQVAIGARLYVDAARFDFTIPNTQIQEWLRRDDLSTSLRTSILQERLRNSSVFSGNVFTADWTYECFLFAIVLEKHLSGSNIEIAIDTVCSSNSNVPLELAPQLLFQMDTGTVRALDEDFDDDLEAKEQKLQMELRTLLESPEVLKFLRSVSTCLHEPLSETVDLCDWVRRVLGNTLAAAIHQALCLLLPNIDERSILAEAEINSDEHGHLTVWLSEGESGGLGVVTQLQELYASDPVKVLNTMHRCLQPGNYEQLDTDIHDALCEITEHGELASAVENIRTASNYHDRLNANSALRLKLSERGFTVSHTFAAVFHSRILRPGSTAETDTRLLHYHNRWSDLENQCGFEIPLNVVSSIQAIEEVTVEDPRMAFERACLIQSMLWIRGRTVRHSSLSSFNPFQTDFTTTERILGALTCMDHSPSVQFTEESWLQDTHLALDDSGRVDLVLSRDQCSFIPEIMANLHITALDTHGLLFFPRLGSIFRRGNEIRLRVELAEAFH